MTRFLDVHATAELINHIGIETVLSEMAGYITDDYRHWDEFEKSPRVVNHSPLGVNELMPIANKNLYSFKYVNGHPANTAKGLLTVAAFGMLAEVETGYPLLLSEMTLLTALRTAATSAVAAKYMARPDSRKMAVIGNGSQSEFQILAFKTLLGIKQFSLYDIDREASHKLCRNLAAYKDLELTIAASVAEAVAGADIVTTTTADKTKAVILTPQMIAPGMHLSGVGGDCPGKTEYHPDIVRSAHVVVEFEPQTRMEGEIQQMPADFAVTELWQILTGAAPARENLDQITLFDSVGFGLEDFSALRYFYDQATLHNAGDFIELIPTLRDPKDLFSLIKKSPQPKGPSNAADTLYRV